MAGDADEDLDKFRPLHSSGPTEEIVQMRPFNNSQESVHSTASLMRHASRLENMRISFNSSPSHRPSSPIKSHNYVVSTESILASSLTNTAHLDGARTVVTVPARSSIDLKLMTEAIPSLMFAVVGLSLAGTLLDQIQHWDVFLDVSELIMLVPVLLNLKGNLEMNMAARLSTAANLGTLDNGQIRNSILFGNLQLMQIQGITVGLIAGFVSLIVGMIFHSRYNSKDEILLILACSIWSASLASFLLGSLMCGIVVVSRKFHINPDNISTPLAASLGDLTTLGILAALAMGFRHASSPLLVQGFSIVIALLSVPWWVYKLRQNRFVADVLMQGWVPLLISMAMSNMTGLVLERYIDQYKPMALLCPILNGLVGNFGAIYTSRIATSLHAHSVVSSDEESPIDQSDSVHLVPATATRSILLDAEEDKRTWKTLVWVYGPFQMLVLVMVAYFGLGHLTLTPLFTLFYLAVSLVVVCDLLVIFPCAHSLL